jgi:predicted enzyme related to lactoylglutathione lyase
MQVHYLEIVTPDVDAVCQAYSQSHGVTFSEPEAGLGNARTGALLDGGKIGVRAPMHETEEPVVRPYLLVEDIEGAIDAAVKNGGEIAHPRWNSRDTALSRSSSWVESNMVSGSDSP